MPGLEIHTLNQDTAQELPALLVTRAGAIAAAGAALSAHEAPETSGAFSFGEFTVPAFDDIDQSPALSVIGDYMPPLETAKEEFERLHDSELVGDLMHRARLSKLTGCIMTDLARNHKGYPKTSRAVRELGLGTTSRETHRVVHFARLAEATGRLPTQEEKELQVDHICRNPACIYHTRLIEGDENNALMAEARKIEPDIIAGQMFYAPALLFELPWLAFAVAEEGGEPAKVISTRLGAFTLRLSHPEEFVVYGERVRCEVYDSLPEPGKKPVNRKSRAKLRVPKPVENHQVLFAKTKFKKKHISDIREKYAATQKAA